MRRRSIPWLSALLALSLAAPAAGVGPEPNTKVRVFAMGAKLNMRWLESRQTYRDYLFALADKTERGPGKPVIVEGADDMASHRTGSDLVVWPESIGLFAALTGPRAQPAREATSLEEAILRVAIAYGKETGYYAALYPDLAQRDPPTRLLALALTDTFGRTFVEAFSELADAYDVWLVTVGDMVQDWHIVCTNKAIYIPPNTGEECAEENPAKVEQLRDPHEPERLYAYEASKPNPSVVTLVFDPDGRIVAKVPKSYITPTELGPDEGELGLDLVPGDVSGSDAVPVETPVGRLGVVVSKPAWMPDIVQKLDQRRADVLVQPEFFAQNKVTTTGIWQPDVLLASGYNDILRHPSFDYLVHAQMQGGVFSFYADHPTHLAVKPRTGREAARSLLGQRRHRGLVDVLPWVVPDERRGESLADRRQRLGEAGEKLLPGEGPECPDPARPGPCDDGHNEGVIWRDMVVNRQMPYRRYRGKIVRTRFSRARPLSPSRREQRNVAVARRDALVVVAYEERRGTRDQILVTVSRDGGRSWSRPARPTGRPRGSTDEWWPAVAIGPKGRVTIAWVDQSSGRARVYYARSPNGRRFGPPHPVDPTAPMAAQWKPALAADAREDRVHIAFIDERERTEAGDLPEAHVYYARIVGGDASEAVRLDTGKPFPRARKFDNSWAPAIAARGKRVVVSWVDFLRFDWDAFARVSKDGGSSFGAQLDVNDTPEVDDPSVPRKLSEAFTDSPSVAIGRRDWVVWTDWRGREKPYPAHRMSDTFISRPRRKNVQVDPYGGRQVSTFSPDICALGRDALVVFQDASKGQNDVRAVYMRGGRKRGKARRVDDVGRRGGNAWRPRLACSSGNVIVLWEDERDGVPQIYFARAKLKRLR